MLAWTALRLQHVMLMSRTEDESNQDGSKRYFVIDVPSTSEAAIQEMEQNIVWLEDQDFDESLDESELHHHALNVARIVDPEKCMSKIHVLPLKPLPNETFELRFLIIMAHQTSDGLSAYGWFNHFIRILNSSSLDIERSIAQFIQPEAIKKRLPPAQEDLYPKIAGSKARQRWFWAIIRVLRHVKKDMSPTFVNPLRRESRLEKAIALEPKFATIFDYSEERRPPMSSGHISASLSPSASARMISMCREAKISIGAGCFALAGLSMMAIHEQRYKDVPPSERPAFAASFPLNPRAFFSEKIEADSCMLAFSEGILMPFLPSDLPVEGRFKLVAKNANRELRMYQKRLKNGKEDKSVLDPHSPGRILATGYLAQIERVDAKMPIERQLGSDAQGELKPRLGKYGATCGVSSVGSLAVFFKPGTYDLENMNGKDLVADYRGLKMGVRARDNEFLVGSSTDADGIVGFGVSYDLNAISQEATENWSKIISGLLEKGSGSRL